MRFGKLDRQITFQALTEVKDAMGGITETWANLATDPTVWAEKRDMAGRETWASQQYNAEIDTVFIVRYRSDITPKMRIAYDGRYYNIEAIKEFGRRDGLEIMAGTVL